MFITVLAIICLNLAVPGTCMTEPVVNSNQEQLTMGAAVWDYWALSRPRNFGSIIRSITPGNSRAGPASSVIALRLTEARLSD